MTLARIATAFAFLVGALALTAPAAAPGTPVRACAALAQADLAHAVDATVEILQAGDVAAAAGLPAYCEIKVRIAPAIGAIVRLPEIGATGRVLVGGCGNLCGSIEMRNTEDALARGYTVAQTDMGHKGLDIGFTDNPQAIEDFAWRATHLTPVLAKALFAAFYGHAPDYSYFRGCSTGGRQAIIEAQLFPDEYDGIIAGAPAQQLAAPNIVWALKANLRADNSVILDEAAIRRLHAAVIATCGDSHGVVEDPRLCRFAPRDLLCGAGGKAGACLTAEQVAAADTIYRGIHTRNADRSVSMGFARGSELGWIAPFAGSNGQPPYALAVAAAYMHRLRDLPNAPTRVQDLDFDRMPVRLTRVDSIPAFGDEPLLLDRFAGAGGKLIVYAGWADDALTPATTLDFIAQQQRGLGGAAEFDRFARLYMVPGLAHCGGGDGAGEIDMLSVLEAWVEKHAAPEALTAYRLKTYPADRAPTRFPIAADAIAFQRRLAPYRLAATPQ